MAYSMPSYPTGGAPAPFGPVRHPHAPSQQASHKVNRPFWPAGVSVLTGLLFGVLSLTTPWSEARLNGDATEMGFGDFAPWGYLYVIGLVPVVALAVVVAGSVRVDRRHRLGVTGTILTSLLVVALYAAWYQARQEGEQLRADAFALVQSVSAEEINAAHHTYGITLGLIAVLLFGLVLISAAWPAWSVHLQLGVTTVLAVLGLILPWFTTLGVTATGNDEQNWWWWQAGGSGLLVGPITLVTLVLLWWAVWRRSVRGRLLLMVLSGALTMGLISAAVAVADADPVDWMSQADRANTTVISESTPGGAFLYLITAAVLMLIVAVRAWWAAYQRAQTQRGSTPWPGGYPPVGRP